MVQLRGQTEGKDGSEPKSVEWKVGDLHKYRRGVDRCSTSSSGLKSGRGL